MKWKRKENENKKENEKTYEQYNIFNKKCLHNFNFNNISEPSDSSISDFEEHNKSINIINDNYYYKYNLNYDKKNKIYYKKLSYNDVKNHIDRYYKLNFSQKYSSSLDILASYLRQKIIYIEL